MMLVDCVTKPVNGSQLFRLISYAIGLHFYPDPIQQHYVYVDLELDTLAISSQHCSFP
jgi:hypothetical protein